MLALLGFLESPLGKLIGWATTIIILVGILTGGYFAWKIHIQNQAMAEFNQKQQEQYVKDQKIIQGKIDAITEAQNQIIEGLQKQLDAVNTQHDDIKAYLDSDEAKKTDRPSSEILKETFRRLNGKK
jgi:hypothetical protein